jgi:hypothetical protein
LRLLLWNTLLWEMVRRAAPDLYYTFSNIRLMLSSSHAPLFTEYVYQTMRSVNFSSGVCEPLTSWLCVLPVPEVGWSDWGSVENILASLKQMGKLEECLARLRHHQGNAALPLSLMEHRRV